MRMIAIVGGQSIVTRKSQRINKRRSNPNTWLTQSNKERILVAEEPFLLPPENVGEDGAFHFESKISRHTFH
jgi:hypothetical protein